MSLRKTVDCFGLDDQGAGLFKIQNKTFKVVNFLPGEKAIVNIETVDRRREVVEIIQLLEKSPNRVNVQCGVYERCGGCQLLHMHYLEQLEFKKNYFKDAFLKEGIKVDIDFVVGAKKKKGYRNKMQVAYKYEKGLPKYGFFEESTHNIVQPDKCLVQTDIQSRIADFVFDFMKTNKISIYNEDKRNGIVRYLLLKEGFVTKEVMVVIVTNGKILPASSNLVKALREAFPQIKTIVQNINNRATNIILGDEEKVLYGDGYIYDYLLDKKFKISAKSFFQINPEQTQKMYNKIIEFAEFNKDDVIIDAYSGVGTIGIILSDQVKNVFSVESNQKAVEDAIANSKLNNINNVRFVCDDATLYLENISKANPQIDGIVIDPPRKGSTITFLENVIKLKIKKVVYVSCEPQTQARDVALLLKNNYEIVKTAVIDMFCGTNNVESICYLKYKG